VAALAEVGNVSASGDLAATHGLAGAVRRGLGWSVVSNVVLRAGSLSVGIALARLLSPGEFGAYAVALTVQAVLMTLADLGLSADLIRSDDAERRAPTVATLGLVSGVSLATLMILTAGPIASSLGSTASTSAIQVLALTLVLSGLGVVPYARLNRAFQQQRLFAVSMTDFVVSTTVTIALVLADVGIMSIAIGRVLGQGLALALQFRLAGVRPRFGFDRSLGRSAVAFGLPVALANLLSWALLNIDTVVVARGLGQVELGFYVLAFNISTWPMSVLGQVVRSVALPAFARADRASGRPDPTLALGVRLSWALGVPTGAFLALLAGPLVVFVYGGAWERSAVVLAPLAVFGALRVLFDLLATYLLARGRAGTTLVIQLAWFVTLVPAVVVGMRTHGLVGVGWAHVVVGVAVILPAYLVAVARAGADLSAVAAALWPPLLFAVPALAVAVLVGSAGEGALLDLLAAGLAGGATYLLLALPWLRRHLSAPPPATPAERPAPVIEAKPDVRQGATL